MTMGICVPALAGAISFAIEKSRAPAASTRALESVFVQQK